MKQINFIRGSGLWRVIIKGREIAFILPEYNNVPIVVNLDRLDKHKKDMKKMKMDKKILKELSELKTEEDMERDIIKDLQRMGWRAYKK